MPLSKDCSSSEARRHGTGTRAWSSSNQSCTRTTANDTFLIGRKAFEAMARMGSDTKSTPDVHNIVLSRTLRPNDYPHVTVSSTAERLFRSLLAAGLVDRVEVSLIPVLLGDGIPLFASPAGRAMPKL